MKKYFTVTDEQKDLLLKQTKLNSDFPRIIIILNKIIEGYLLTIQGTENDIDLYIERLETVGLNLF